MKRHWLRWVVVTLAMGAVALMLGLGPLVERVMTPSTPFDERLTPPPPDYDDPGSWSALPDREDAADAAPDGHPGVDQRSAKVDVFYVHPTSAVGSAWNASTTDATINDGTDRLSTGIQATAFNGCCAIYAPRYRQANGSAFFRPSPDGDRAMAVAYGDVKRAFESFQRRRGADRPFILASHSQGTVMLERLLFEELSGKPAGAGLVAAYLAGGRVTVAGLAERAPDLPPCQRADDLRCVIAWNARSPDFVPTTFELARPDPRTRLCTNPLTWRLDGEGAPASANLGGVFLETNDHAVRPEFADARCVDGVLQVSQVKPRPRDVVSRVLDHLMGSGNYHPVEYQLFFMNLRENANLRATLALAEQSPR